MSEAASPDLEALLKQGADAVAANMTHIAQLEHQLQERDATIQSLKQANAELQAKQASVSAPGGLQVSQDEAAKVASVLVHQGILAPADQAGAIEAMQREPKRILGCFDKIAAKLPAPFSMADGGLVPKGERPFGGESATPKKERWY